MSLSESVARLKASKATPVFHVWRCKDLLPMFLALGFTEEQCKEAGLQEKRMEVHPGLSTRGEHDVHFRVGPLKPASRDEDAEFNISHPCPGHPLCP